MARFECAFGVESRVPNSVERNNAVNLQGMLFFFREFAMARDKLAELPLFLVRFLKYSPRFEVIGKCTGPSAKLTYMSSALKCFVTFGELRP